MKKVKFEKKLSLKKETVANLSNTEMNLVKGGLLSFSRPPQNCSGYNC